MDWAVLGVGIATLAATVGIGLPALVLSRRAERRSTERAVVDWAPNAIAPGRFTVQHIGVDPAFEVLVVLVFDGESTRATAERVEYGGFVEVRSLTLYERDRRIASLRETGWKGAAGTVQVSIRVTWRSASGAWSHQLIERDFPEEFGSR